jgi:type I restriction enzyme S subunit
MAVPKLRFKAFDGDWEKTTLGEVVKFSNGKRVPLSETDRQKRQGTYRYYGASGVIDYVDDYLFDGQYILIGEDGANIITRSSTLAFVVEGQFWVNNHAHIFQSKHGDNVFLATYLESLNYERFNSGTAQPKLNLENLKKVPVANPPKPEQTKIASFLSAVDEKISQLTQKHELLSQYKQGMMQKLFSQQIRFKADDGSEFGEWEEKELHQIFQIKAGGDIEKSSVSEVRTSEFSYPIFANSDKNKGFYGWANKFKYKEAVTVTGRGNLGIAVARNEPFYPIVRLLVLLPLVKQNLKFFEEQINLLDIVSESTGVPQLTAPQLSKYKVNVPCLEEQTKIANFLSSIDQKIDVVAQQIEQAKQWKKGLLQQMFV